jgi:predicted transcriptional regulator
LEYKPVASVELIEDSSVEVDPLFDQILIRRSNKTVYDDRPLSPRAIDQLLLAYDTRQHPLTITTDSAQKQRLAELAMEGVRIEATDESLLRELAHTARLTQAELEQYRNGLDLTGLGA